MMQLFMAVMYSFSSASVSNIKEVLGIECVFKFISDAITEEDAEGGFKHRFAILWKASRHQSTQLLHSRCSPFQRSALDLLYEGGISFFPPVISADTNAMASSLLCLMASLSFLSMFNQFCLDF